jgi:DhnA family fructose-bisphosphate aldolase class Ia
MGKLRRQLMQTPSWNPGMSLRLSRLFDDQSGRGVIVAMDHAFGGVHPGLEDPGETLTRILEGGPDGVLVTPGTARQFQSLFAGRSSPAMIVSIDYVLFHPYPGSPDAVEEQGMASSVEEALRLGADAIKVLMIFGRVDPGMQARNLDTIGRVADKCRYWGLPLMVEPVTWGHRFDGPAKKDVNVLRDMARIAFEFGADIVKSDFPEDPEDFGQIKNSCPVPVMVLGGAKKADEEGLLRAVITLMQKGAAGATFGRNVWQHPDPARMVRSIKHCVHDLDIDAALAELNGVTG